MLFENFIQTSFHFIVFESLRNFNKYYTANSIDACSKMF